MTTNISTPLEKFYETLNEVQKELLKEYIKTRKYESLSISFDKLLEKIKNET
ncbi:MAG: hypothetical protein UU90_C0018G0015 [candidate division WWE3 bacterium GW2011_GWD2_42_11]|nr:MAG: hypothetical protein UU86_C0009G0011 [candidate division WWE3 bacterium GW2011_GWC1_42_102]KKS28757.1 MAG: hypothetical protein UU90_C0018G0015 [candidate division WWE3 bacterium GW2011_GWD2_42_11]KKS60447.1 MAG: hypothetical protein UV25_C0008G0010 [candidate division WWE3 bacterium GW2011_GWB1_42_41]